jgi:ankyrin repeat protein
MSGALPPRADLGQLRRQAKELRDAVRAGDAAAVERVRAQLPGVGAATLATAQLVIAREYGFASWPRLKAQVETASLDLAQRVDTFLAASVGGRTGRAARLLAEEPAIAGYDFRTAVVLGDAARVNTMLDKDPGLATRADQGSGWPPLLGVCMSGWHRIDPGRSDGLVAVAGLLLDAGADPNTTVGSRPGRRDYCSTLFAAAGCADHPALTRLLLERGARPGDHTIYLAAFHAGHACLRLLLEYAGLTVDSTALAAPLSTGDLDGARLLLDAGADPNRPLQGSLFGEAYPDEPPIRPVAAAVEFDGPPELTRLLLDRDGDPDTAGWDGRSAYRTAVRRGRPDVAAVLLRSGARDDGTDLDRLLDVCLRADRATARRLVADDPGLLGRLNDDDHGVVVRAADCGDVEAVRLMLDLGFPADIRAGVDGATPLHAAAASGSVQVVRLLVDREADLTVRDGHWNATALAWATVGSGFRLGRNPKPDWPATVRLLIEAGVSLDGAWVGGKPPSPDVAEVLAGYGIGPDDDE